MGKGRLSSPIQMIGTGEEYLAQDGRRCKIFKTLTVSLADGRSDNRAKKSVHPLTPPEYVA